METVCKEMPKDQMSHIHIAADALLLASTGTTVSTRTLLSKPERPPETHLEARSVR